MNKTILQINQELNTISEIIVQNQIDMEYDEFVQEMSFLHDQAALSYDLDAEFYGTV
ncbi:MAG: hypothetical protein ACO3AG_08035 [Fluviibacter sp.]|jgi:hypothetical protein